MGRQSTWSVSVSVLLLGLVSKNQFEWNLISSEYMVHQSTWVIRVHGLSEYMGVQSTWGGHTTWGGQSTCCVKSTWVMTVHGPSDYMALLLRQVSTHKFHSNPKNSTTLFEINDVAEMCADVFHTTLRHFYVNILDEELYVSRMLYYRTVYMESYNENNNLDQGRIQELKKKEVASSKSLPPPLGALVFTSKEYTFWHAPPATPTSESAHVDKDHLTLSWKYIDCNHPQLIKKQQSNQLKT